MKNLSLLSSGYGSHLFWVKALVMLCVMILLCLLCRFGLRRFRFKQSDLKNSGLNHRQRRQWLAERKTKKRKKSYKRHF